MNPATAKKTLLLSLVGAAIIVAFSPGQPKEKTRRFIGFGAVFLLASFAVEAAPALGAGIAVLATTALLLQFGQKVFDKTANIVAKPWQALAPEASVITVGGTTADSAAQPPAGAQGPIDASGKIEGKGAIIGKPYSGTHTLGNWESDNALDISLPVGTAITAPFAGNIGHDAKFGQFDSRARFHGMRLYVMGKHGEAAFMQHLEKLAGGIRQGSPVKSGQIIGYSGTGNGVPHLHFAVRPPASPYSYQRRTYR